MKKQEIIVEKIAKYAVSFNAYIKEQTMSFIQDLTYQISPNKTAVLITIFAIALVLQTQGYCAGTAAPTEMDTMATNIVDTIFAPWVRKTALAFGGGWGMFKSISGGSFTPLLAWGGIGLFVNFIPKIIAWF